MLPMTDINKLLLQVAQIVTSSRDDPRRECLLKMIACVLNKQVDDAHVSSFVDSVVFDSWTSRADHDRRKESLELQSWVVLPVFRWIDSRLRKRWCYEQVTRDTSWCNC